MSNSPLWTPTPVAVTSGSTANTFGAWTALGTTPFSLKKLGIIFSQPSEGANNIALNIGIGSAPSNIMINYLYMNIGWRFHNFPLFFPKGAAIYGQVIGGNVTSASSQVQLIGYGGGWEKDQGFLVGSGGLLSSNTDIWASVASGATAQMTSAVVPHRIKKLYIIGGLNENFTLNIGIGPSTSVTETLFTGLSFPATANYDSIPYELDVDIPPNMNIFFANPGSYAPYVGLNYLC
jgi:hypothetical protein